MRARLLLALFGALAGCAGPGVRPTAVLRAQYGLTAPLGGPAGHAHEATLAAGVLEPGPGARAGALLQFRARPQGVVQGAAFGAAALLTVSAMEPARPFFVGEAGLDLLGLSSVRQGADVDRSFDFASPWLTAQVGLPLVAGLALSAGAQLQYVWRVFGHAGAQHLVMAGLVVGFGFFDPTTPADRHALNFLFRR